METSNEADDRGCAVDNDANSISYVRLRGQYCLTRVVFLRCLGFVYMAAFLVALNDNGALVRAESIASPSFKYRTDHCSSVKRVAVQRCMPAVCVLLRFWVFVCGFFSRWHTCFRTILFYTLVHSYSYLTRTVFEFVAYLLLRQYRS